MHCQKTMKNKTLIESLEKIKKENYLVIVEGKKDRTALQSFGINRIVELKNRPLFQVIEDINEDEVVILTDLDSEGRKLFGKLRYFMQRRGIKINNKMRNEIFRTKLRNIEGLDSYLKLYCH